MIGGKLTEVWIGLEVSVTVRDKFPYDDRSFKFPLTPQTRCLGVGDSLWWQAGRYMWTPKESKREHQGKDFDIIIYDKGKK